MAEEQFAGRGQHNARWLAEPGKNLTFSILLYPVFLQPKQQFLLNIAVSIAINDVLRGIIGSQCKIKWPNDMFYGDDKLGGILIENTISGNRIKSSVIGIGINVNQENFPGSIQNVTSLKNITGIPVDRENLLNKILDKLESRYLELQQALNDDHISQYINSLYRFGEIHKYRIDGSTREGRISGIGDEGRLILNIDGNLYYYGLKEIEYII